MIPDVALRDEIAGAANVLARLGLVTAYGHVSARAGAASGAASGASPVTPLSAGEITSWRAVGGELFPRLWQHLRSRPGSPGSGPGEEQG